MGDGVAHNAGGYLTPPEDVMAVLGKLEQILEQAQKAGCVIERVTDGAGAVGLRSA